MQQTLCIIFFAGSGGYADNTTGAVSATGTGEAIMRVCLSHRILTSIDKGKAQQLNTFKNRQVPIKTDDHVQIPKRDFFFSGLSAQDATEEGLNYMRSKVGGSGGAVTVSKNGDVGIYFTSQRMAWAYRKGSQDIQSGIDSLPSKLGQK